MTKGRLWSKLQELQEATIDALLEILRDRESRTASDMANATRFLKDNNMVIERPLPSSNHEAAAEILEGLEDPEGVTGGPSGASPLPPGLLKHLQDTKHLGNDDGP